MAFLDISCPNCGSFHAEGSRATVACPECGSRQAIVLLHVFEIDDRQKQEKDFHRRLVQEDHWADAQKFARDLAGYDFEPSLDLDDDCHRENRLRRMGL